MGENIDMKSDVTNGMGESGQITAPDADTETNTAETVNDESESTQITVKVTPSQPAGEPSVPLADITEAPVVPPVPDIESAPNPIDIQKPSKKRASWFKPEIIFIPALRKKFGNHARIAACVFLIAILSGAGTAAYILKNEGKTEQVQLRADEHFAAVSDQFAITGTVPANDSVDVSPTTAIKLRFNRPVDPEKLNGDFFISPEVDGVYTKGETDKDVVFTPKVPFAQGTIVKAMLHGEFSALDGTEVGADYFMTFTTSLPSQGVIFGRKEFYSNDDQTSAQSNQKISYSLGVGKDVSKDGEVNLYKTNMAHLTKSFVYKDTVQNGYTYESPASTTVDVTGMKLVSTKKGITDGGAYDVTQDAGVYVAVATSAGKQSGHVWVVYSDYGVLLKQDDQKVVLSAQNLKTNQSEKAEATFYNAKNQLTSLAKTTIDGATSVTVAFAPKLDFVTAKIADQEVFVPVSLVNSFADARTKLDLAKMHHTYALTDKTAYRAGETARFAGFDRTDNDAVYAAQPSAKLKLYVAHSAYDSKHLADLSVTTGADGTFNGQFVVGAGFLSEGLTTEQATVYLDSGAGAAYDQAIASFTVTSQKVSAYDLKANFEKEEYFANEAVVASIQAYDDKGQALKNTKVTVNIFSGNYSETESSYNNQASIGQQVGSKDMVIQLDANGQAKVSVDLSKLESGQSHYVKVQAKYNDPASATIAASAVAEVHQANAKLHFGFGRTVVQAGSSVVARIYGEDLKDAVLANAPLEYKLSYTTYNSQTQKQDETVLSTGSSKLDAAGYAEISASLGNYKSKDANSYITLTISTKDSSNNKFTTTQTYYVQDGNTNTAYSMLQLSGLDISGSSGDVKVGDEVTLHINSPSDINALVVAERGRIRTSNMTAFKKGSNDYVVKITADMQPSFALSFSYFANGKYVTEGVHFTVDASDKQASVALTTDKQAYTAGEEMSLTVANKDSSGKPLSGTAIVSIVDVTTYRFDDRISSIFDSYYAPRELTTNSSSSLTGIGTGGGGKCGGGFGDVDGLANPTGTQLYWNPSLTLDTAGKSVVKLKLPIGSWKVITTSMSGQTIVGMESITVTAK